MCLSGVALLRGAAFSQIALSPSLSLLFSVVIVCIVFFLFLLFVFYLSQHNTPFSLPLFLLQLELQRTEVDDYDRHFNVEN